MKKKLELTCVVKEVKVDLRNPDHVWVSAVIEELDKKADTPVGRIVRIGMPPESNLFTSMMAQAMETITELDPLAKLPKPTAGFIFYLTEAMFVQLGRPTVGDTICFNGSTLKEE